MSRLWPRLRRAEGEPPRGLPAGHALERDSRRLGLPRLRGARQAGLPALLAAALTLTAGCAVKLSYNKLDFIAAWQLGRLVDLAPPQKALFDREFEEFWAWHRATQLELYSKDIRELATRVDKPLDAATVESYLDRSQAHLARTLQAIGPEAASVLKTFDDAQVKEMLDELAERRRDKAEESAEMTTEELREYSVDQMERNLKRWTGPLTREQKLRIRSWASERTYAGTTWHQYQEAWAAAFTEVLAHRRQPDFERRFVELLDHGRVPYEGEMAKIQAQNRALWIGVMADLSAMLTPAQRKHLRAKLVELADDLDELAREQRSG